jgi:hypothetical protein
MSAVCAAFIAVGFGPLLLAAKLKSEKSSSFLVQSSPTPTLRTNPSSELRNGDLLWLTEPSGRRVHGTVWDRNEQIHITIIIWDKKLENRGTSDIAYSDRELDDLLSEGLIKRL